MMHAYCDATDRFELWARFLSDQRVRDVAEIGVFRGAFAARMLRDATTIERYFMLDPWRNLADWNKPANTSDEVFEQHFLEAMAATAFAADKRRVLRGRTIDVVDRIADESLDFVYVDGDHTLRGITLDLISSLPKVRVGGWIGGDDFCDSIWQHPQHYEPTLIFPWAVHFAEAHGLTIHALPHNQFAMQKAKGEFRFVDHTGRYGDRSLRRQLQRTPTSDA